MVGGGWRELTCEGMFLLVIVGGKAPRELLVLLAHVGLGVVAHVLGAGGHAQAHEGGAGGGVVGGGVGGGGEGGALLPRPVGAVAHPKAVTAIRVHHRQNAGGESV